MGLKTRLRLELLLSLGPTLVPHWHDDVAVTLLNTLIRIGDKQQCKSSKRRTTAIIICNTARSWDECTGCKDKPVLVVWSNIVGQRGQETHLTSGGQMSCYGDGHGDSEKKDEVEQFLCLEINKITWRRSSNGLGNKSKKLRSRYTSIQVVLILLSTTKTKTCH